MNRELNYFKHLDTLRFVAFFLVFWHHAFAGIVSTIPASEWLKPILHSFSYTGKTGVNLFFVISGFLITYILLEERKKTGKIHLKFFYLRRILRIWPLYFAFLLVALFVLPLFSDAFQFHGNYFLQLVFLNNYDMEHTSLAVGVAWSVAIEEQFYIVWPLLLIFIKKPKVLFIASYLLFIVALTISFQHQDKDEFYTIYNLHYLFIGTISAQILAHYPNLLLYKIMDKNSIFLSIILSVVFVGISQISEGCNFISFALLPFCFGHIVLHLAYHTNNAHSSLLSELGKQTYGMYLFHYTLLLLVSVLVYSQQWFEYSSGIGKIIIGCCSFVFTVLLAKLSYRYFEQPFLVLKSNYSVVKTKPQQEQKH